MKKIFLFLVIAVSAITVSAQQAKYVYCELVGSSKMLSTKVTVEVDFGQATKFWSDNRLVDENKKPIKFNSMVDAMNWMGNQGWEFAQAYVVTNGNQNVYHWLLKKDVTKLTEEEKKDIIEGFKTKSNSDD